MSERLSLDGWAALQQEAGFAERPAVRQASGSTDAPVHFAPAHPGERMGHGPAAFPDPDGDPLRAAWTEGYEAGVAEARGHEVPFTAWAVAEQIARLGKRIDARLAERLERAAVALASQLLEEAVLDRASLERRLPVALAALATTTSLSARCHPDALEAARSLLPADVTLSADPAFAPNAFQLECAEAGVADGPEEWGRALADALARC